MVIGIFALMIFGVPVLTAQRFVQKSFLDPEIKSINIDATHNFELSVSTSKGDEIILEASFDGEYSNDLFLNLRESGNTLLISTNFTPQFENPGDKLSAHKVVAVSLNVVMPEQKKVIISGTGCNIIAKGDYRRLHITSNDGQCLLDQVSGSVEVATQSGDIHVRAARAKINAESKYGKVGENSIPSGGQRYGLRTVTGNILLNKTD